MLISRLAGKSKIQRVDILISRIEAVNDRNVWGFTVRLLLKIETRAMLQSKAIALRKHGTRLMFVEKISSM